MTITTAAEIFSNYGSRFSLPSNHPILGPLQINLTGPGGGSWVITVSGIILTAVAGTDSNATSVMEADTASYIDVCNGVKTYYDLLSTGKMKILKGHKNFLELSQYIINNVGASE